MCLFSFPCSSHFGKRYQMVASLDKYPGSSDRQALERVWSPAIWENNLASPSKLEEAHKLTQQFLP